VVLWFAVCPVIADLLGEFVTVKPLGETARARTVASALSMRDRLRPMPPTRVAPIGDGVRSSSRGWSAMNPMSTQSTAEQKCSAIPASRVTISPNMSIPAAGGPFLGVVRDRLEPQHVFALLCAFNVRRPKWTLQMARS
jgi:hypothetical protein